jgi:hypothetical protein
MSSILPLHSEGQATTHLINNTAATFVAERHTHMLPVVLDSALAWDMNASSAAVRALPAPADAYESCDGSAADSFARASLAAVAPAPAHSQQQHNTERATDASSRGDDE